MSTCLAGRTIRRLRKLITLCLIAAPAARVAGQDNIPVSNIAAPMPTVAKGEIVSQLPKDLGHVFQAKDGRHWFSSSSQGAFRYDGKTITRFSKKDGLADDGVGIVQEDKSGKLYFNTNRGISKFDGQFFTTLEPKATGEWKKEPDDLWFSGGQDSGVVYRYDGQSLYRLAFPKTKAGDDATVPRDKFPNAKYSPYDVYTILKTARGTFGLAQRLLGPAAMMGSHSPGFRRRNFVMVRSAFARSSKIRKANSGSAIRFIVTRLIGA